MGFPSIIKLKPIHKLLVFTALIYVCLEPLTYHPDNKLVLRWAGWDHGRVWNIWKQDLGELEQFNYPPLHFYLDKLQFFIAQAIGGDGFYDWLSSSNSLDFSQRYLPRYTFAIKLPLLLFALGVGYLLFRLSLSSKATTTQALGVSAAWLFNPVVMYSVVCMGQNDVMAIAFFLLGWLLLHQRRLLLSGILIGLAASIKMFPLFWLPFLLVVDSTLELKRKLWLLLVSVGIYMLTLLPFLPNPIFRSEVFSGGIDRFFIAHIDIGYEKSILLVPLLLILVFAAGYKQAYLKSRSPLLSQATILLVVNAILLFFNHFNPQWFTWLVPFWAIWLFAQPIKYFKPLLVVSLLVVGAWFFILLLIDDFSLFFGMVLPINPDFSSLPSVKQLLMTRQIDPSLYVNYAHTVLAATALSLLFAWLRAKSADQEFQFNPKLSLRIPLTRPIRFIVGLVGAIGSVWLLHFFVQLMPLPLVATNPTVNTYSPLTTELTQTFTGEHPNLSRIYVYLNNPNLQNRQSYSLLIKNSNRVETLYKQVFSGFNVGFQSELRFDIPLQKDSRNRHYEFVITPLEDAEIPLQIGRGIGTDFSNFVVKGYYEKSSGFGFIKFAFMQANDRFLSFLSQLPWLLPLIGILLWLLV